ncbi:RkpR, polysaccharide export protein [Labrenzia sp. R5_0]|jgi:capsular polysaccharide transport system permease protein|uniref:RkpR, polysaccharide export protein n=1 Tax=Labrenzia sp. R5_0 TaxID=2821108 RepID=UPI001ADB582D|nr:RkpR, polysaccharide export protein [Labrenzia sp. R5_0]MBO9457882.1 RkpR, polysaccharide export protein [Labrenzia sp. R5_0]
MSSAEKLAESEASPGSKGAVFKLPSKKDGPVAKKREKDGKLVSRLKKSGLDPQKLLDLALPGTTAKSVAKTRHRLIILGFFLFVALPSAAFSAYMFFWASDQYHSTAAFAVRSSNTVAPMEILGMVMGGGGGSESTTSNSYIVTDYIQSQAILEDLPKELDLQTIFNREASDFLFSMGTDLPIEDQLSYWNGMVDVSFDATSSVIYVDVRSFRPTDSVMIAEAILERSEILVNKLSESNRRQSVRYAEEALARAEARLKAIRKQMLAYRQETQEVDPEANAEIAAEMIAGLDRERASHEAEKATLMSYLDEDSPRIRMLDQQIAALQGEIASVRKRLGTGGTSSGEAGDRRNNLSLRLADYSELAVEEEFAQQLYVTSLASLEKARQEADNKSLYLATFIRPTLSEEAQYPSRFLYSLAVFLMLAGLWSVVVLLYYNVRDRT